MKNHQLAGMTIGASRDLLAEVRAICEAEDRQSEEQVHRVRVCLKRVRAYWRLMRFALGKDAEQAGNERCKRAAKMLSAARDHVVMLGTLDDLHERASAKAEQADAEEASEPAEHAAAFDAARQSVRPDADDDHPVEEVEWSELIALIDEEIEVWATMDKQSIVDDDIRRGMDRTYRKARRGYKRSTKSPDSETLHSWRKWAKRYLHQAELLAADQSKPIKKLDKLASKLGEYQDLAVLHRHVSKAKDLAKADRRTLREHAEKRQAKVLKKAMKAGRKLFKAKGSRLHV